MRILITGGAGFVGSRCGSWLRRKGHNVIMFDNMTYGSEDNLIDDNGEKMPLILGDVRNASQVEEAMQNCDTVLHFAAIAPLPDNQKDPNNSYQNNVIGTINVLESCRKFNIKKFLLASTSAVYENNHEPVLTEDLKVSPDLVYAMSKQSSEQICLSYFSCYGLPVSIVRFFNVYGPHQNYKRKAPPLMGYITREISNNRSPVLHSDGEQRRDYVHVSDLCKLVEVVLKNESSLGEVFNACSGETWSVNEIFDLCAKRVASNIRPTYRSSEMLWNSYPELFESSFPLKKSRIKKETEKYSCGSYEKAKRMLGWSPSVKFEEGVFESVDVMLSSMKQEKLL